MLIEETQKDYLGDYYRLDILISLINFRREVAPTYDRD